MKICWMHSHFLNWMGGHQYVYEICKRLTKKHQVTLITSAATSEAAARFKEIGVNFTNLHRPTTNNPFYWLFLPIFIKSDIRLIKPLVEKSNIVITSYFPAHLWAQCLAKPYIQILYEPLAFFYDREFLQTYSFTQRLIFRFIRLIYAKWDRQALLKARRVFTLSQHRRFLTEKFYRREDIQVLGGGVDTEIFKKIATARLRQQYGRRKIILHCTDFTATKGTDLLLRALVLLVKDIPEVLLLITENVVNPLLKQKYTKIIENYNLTEKVTFLGKLNREDLPKYMSLADVLVQPSRNQSLNLAVLEAMACETPVITCPEASEHIADGTAGYFVDPEDINLLSNKICQILKNPNLRENMGRRGRKLIIKKYTWNKVVESLEKHF